MKIAWAVLLISALTDGIIASGTGLMTAMTATETAQIPNAVSLWVAGLGGVVAFARTVQQALKATPANTAQLTGKV